MLTITPEVADDWRAACDAYELASQEGYTDEEILTDYGLSRDAACNWAIKGYTIQGELNQRNTWVLIWSYTEDLRGTIDDLKQIILNMMEQVETQRAAVMEHNKD